MKKEKPAIKAVLFDLGKVILHFNFDPAFKRLSKVSQASPRDIEDFFINSGLEVLYDGGKISSREFFGAVKKALGLSVSFNQFKRIWNEIFTLNLPMARLIGKLKPRTRLVLLSNTNEMHFTYIRNKYSVLNNFDKLIASFQVKMRKPDARLYQKAARACLAKPNQILYIDDRADLTDAAKDLGFNVFTYKNNFNELKKTIKEMGLL